jgi:hypothetical protein
LESTYNEHIADLELLSTQFEEQLSILKASELPLNASLAEEMIGIPLDDSPEPQMRHVHLQNRISEFQKEVLAKQKVIEQLVDEWNSTRAEIIALAVEVLGHNKIFWNQDVGHMKQSYPQLAKALDISAGRNQTWKEGFEGTLNELTLFENRVDELASQTKETMHQQQKARSFYLGFVRAN